MHNYIIFSCYTLNSIYGLGTFLGDHKDGTILSWLLNNLLFSLSILTDSLKQAVGHEAIKLLVNVDEDDYVAGRIKLLQNLKDWELGQTETGQSAGPPLPPLLT